MAIPEWIKKELRTNFARASRAGRQAAKTEPRAARASYLAKENVLRIELTKWSRDQYPREADSGPQASVAERCTVGGSVRPGRRPALGELSTSISAFQGWCHPCLRDPNGWRNWVASAAIDQRRPRRLQPGGMDERAGDRAVGQRPA